MESIVTIKKTKQSVRIPELENIHKKPITEIIREYYIDKQIGIQKISLELHLSINQIYKILKQTGIEPRHERKPNRIQIQRMAQSLKDRYKNNPKYRQTASEKRKEYYKTHPEEKEKSKNQLNELRKINNERLKTDEEYRIRQLSGILENAKQRTKLYKEELYELYWNQKLNMKQMATKLSVHVSSIQAAMKKYGIPTRNKKQVQDILLQNEEHITKLSERTKKYWQNPEYRKLKTEQAIGINNPFYGKHHTEETKEIILKSVCRSPNISESYLDYILQKNFPNKFKYVGDGSYLIHGLSVDFISIDFTKIIEFFGFDWHHKDNAFGKKIPYVRTEEGRTTVLKKYGYNLLVIWDYELKKGETYIINKIQQFIDS